MKVFDTRFFIGTILTGIGATAAIMGALSLLPPAGNVIPGLLLVAVGLPMATFGRRFAKNAYPHPAKTSIETLRKAGLLDKDKK